MRSRLALGAVLAVSACTTQVPDSGAGFQDYNSYMRQNATPAASSPAAPSSSAPGFSTAGAAAAIDRASGVTPAAAPAAPAPAAQPGLVTDSANRPRGNAPSTIREDTGEMQYAAEAMSDEQDFQAVSSRETIESDKQRIERNRAQYTVDQPTALPERKGGEGPNIVQYALSTTNLPGQPIYKRSSLGLSNPERACARYGSPDLAQQAFLEAGGPEKDRKGLDPDGDGFACSWDPRPFRTALQ
jgi:hypothetical protein